MEEFISKLFTKFNNNFKSIKASLSKNLELQLQIKEASNYLPEDSNFSQRLFHLSKDLKIIPTCSCGKICSFINYTIGYSNFCGKTCSAKSNMRKAQKLSNTEYSNIKRKETLKNVYGVENIFQTEKVKDEIKKQRSSIEEKRKKTNLVLFGTEYAIQNEGIKDKVKATNMKKFGVSSLLSLKEIRDLGKDKLNSEEIKKRRKQTNLERFGVENLFQKEGVLKKVKQANLIKHGVEFLLESKEIQDKVKQTNLIKYGVEQPFQSVKIQDKVKQTNLIKYGVNYPWQSDEIQDKVKQVNLIKYGVKNPCQSDEIKYKILKNSYHKLKEKFKDKIEFLFSFEEYIGCKKQGYDFKCLSCNSIFQGSLNNGLLPRCLKCKPLLSGFSKLEKSIVDWLKNFYNKDIIENKRGVLYPKELDIYLPDYKLALEFNGLFWHSELNNKDQNYHLDKTEECLKKDIQLIHIFEDEWINNKQDIVKSIIKNKLGFTGKVYARKTEFKELSRVEGSNFLEQNHLQGDSISISNYYGLFFENKLVQLIGVGKSRYNKNYDYELIRSCTLLNITVIGGFEKLVKNLPLQGSIISYVDRRYFNGYSYKGWNYIGKTNPNYFYMKDYRYRESRLKYQKHKLSKLFPDVYDINLTEWQNMQLAGYDRIWDCGNFVFSKQL